MLQVGYVGEQRLHISEYDFQLHEGKVRCADGHILIAKKGAIREHHFCHRPKEGNSDCSGKESKGTWHCWWQDRLLPSNLEFRFKKEVLKIADSINIIGPNKDTVSIVEFQSSKMEVEEMRFREKFYTRSDLMSHLGFPICNSILTWIFDLSHCDMEIDHIFGDIVCFRWIKGSKFMFPAKCNVFWDYGKRDLIYIYGIDKPNITESKIIGRLVSLEDFDRMFFAGALKPNLDEDSKRLNCHKIADYITIQSDEKRAQVVELTKLFYFETAKTSKKKSDTNKKIKVKKGDILKLLE